MQTIFRQMWQDVQVIGTCIEVSGTIFSKQKGAKIYAEENRKN